MKLPPECRRRYHHRWVLVQTIALVLAYMTADQAAMVMSGLPADLQRDLAMRLAVMDRTSPEVVAQVLEKQRPGDVTTTMRKAARPGTVYLVGGGPGDAGLLTLRGAALLASCDLVAYDHLAPKEVLDLVPASAERICVGKRKGRASWRQEEINWLLRCHHSDEVHEIDVRTIEFLSMVDRKLGGNHGFHVISGYRSPAYNEWLRQAGRGVAKRSLHLEGRAIDVRIPGVPLANLRRAALSLEYGGVGYYPRTDFVHLDSGRIRTW